MIEVPPVLPYEGLIGFCEPQLWHHGSTLEFVTEDAAVKLFGQYLLTTSDFDSIFKQVKEKGCLSPKVWDAISATQYLTPDFVVKNTEWINFDFFLMNKNIPEDELNRYLTGDVDGFNSHRITAGALYQAHRIRGFSDEFKAKHVRCRPKMLDR